MDKAILQTMSVELRKLEAEQLESVAGTSLVPNVANNILGVQHDAKKKVFAVIIENTTQILANEKPTFSIKMAYLGIFSYTETVNEQEFLHLICEAAETIYNAAIFQKILDITTSFGIVPLRAYITSITPANIEGLHIEETDIAVTLPEQK